MPPVIALLTDFGTADPYVGAMKGAILSVCPDAILVDILHEVPAHDVAAGALALDAAYRHFPPGAVFVVVVDPGVGTPRRPLVIGAGRWLFVGPDNGVFTFVLEAHPSARVHLLASPLLFREPVSPVFHGRDVFGPSAARLARGLALEEAGPEVTDPVRLPVPASVRRDDACEGSVLAVDRFGNMITSLGEPDLATLRGRDRRPLEVLVGRTCMPLVSTYGEVAEGELCALVGSSGRLEVAANRARAAETLGAGVGTAVVVRPTA
jgi:S-adenosylmethionine hydrolase